MAKISKMLQTDKMHPSKKQSLIESGSFVACWLNDPENNWGYGPGSQQQVVDLVRGLVALRKKVMDGTKVAQARQEIAAINEMMAKYPYMLQLGKVSGDGRFHFYESTSPGALVDIVFRLARAGVLDKLRRCERCGDWFFARVDWGKFCTPECQKKANRETPEFKENNRIYQGDRYRKFESPNKRHYRKGKSVAEVRELAKKERKRRK